MSNGITFLIEHDSSGKKIVVHHDRIEPSKSYKKNNLPNEVHEERIEESDDDFDSSADESNDVTNGMEQPIERRYPVRIRTQRRVEGPIPWEALDIDVITGK